MKLKIGNHSLVGTIGLSFLTLAMGCMTDSIAPEMPRIQIEEYLTNDPIYAGSSGEMVRLYKKKFLYQSNKMVAIDLYDFNPNTNDYDSGYRYEEFNYSNEGKLRQAIQFLTPGLKVIKDYTYPSETVTQVIRSESGNNGIKELQDWWVMEKSVGSIVIKYYQPNNELYAQLNCTLDGEGNVISLSREPALPTGTIYYEYDDSPNPYRFSELAGNFGADSEKYISANNVISLQNDFSNKSIYTIEYGSNGYPITITSRNSKKYLPTSYCHTS